MDNNETLDLLTRQFRERYDGMAEICAAAEEAGRWDKNRDGSMEGFAFAALSGAILSLIVSDGNVGERETAYLNSAFGFDYTVDDLLGLFRFSASDLRENAVQNVTDTVRALDEADPAAGAEFCTLLKLACRIISESDDGVAENERALISRLEEAAE